MLGLPSALLDALGAEDETHCVIALTPESREQLATTYCSLIVRVLRGLWVWYGRVFPFEA